MDNFSQNDCSSPQVSERFIHFLLEQNNTVNTAFFLLNHFNNIILFQSDTSIKDYSQLLRNSIRVNFVRLLTI